jgi:hypothetical protein
MILPGELRKSKIDTSKWLNRANIVVPSIKKLSTQFYDGEAQPTPVSNLNIIPSRTIVARETRNKRKRKTSRPLSKKD